LIAKHTHQAPIGPASVGFFMQHLLIHQLLSAGKVA